VKLASAEIDKRIKSGPPLVSANFVIPYPPGFPIMVPGQVIDAGTIEFMRKLDVKEIHGYDAALGLKLSRPRRWARRPRGIKPAARVTKGRRRPRCRRGQGGRPKKRNGVSAKCKDEPRCEPPCRRGCHLGRK
jgi:arginine decarboxylase